jgi:hypothetical protein
VKLNAVSQVDGVYLCGKLLDLWRKAVTFSESVSDWTAQEH